MHLGTASGVEGQVTGLKIVGPPAFTPALLASTRQQPLPQPPLPLQEPDFKELDDPEGYDNFTNVPQVLNGFEIDENLRQNRNVEGNSKENLEFWEFLRCFILYIKRNQIWFPFAFLGRATYILF
mgnify:FL=1